MNLKSIVEMQIGDKVSDYEMEQAEIYARSKRYNIVKNEGDLDGKRFEPNYLAKLIAETVLQNRTTSYCFLKSLEMSIKKDCDAH